MDTSSSSPRDDAQERAGRLLNEKSNLSPERVMEIILAATVDLKTAEVDPTAIDPRTGDRTVIATETDQRVISWGLAVRALEEA